MSLFLEQWAVSGGLGAGTDMITRPFSKPPLAARWGGGRANRWGEAGQADTRREEGRGCCLHASSPARVLPACFW